LPRQFDNLAFYECRGDLGFLTNDKECSDLVRDWAWSGTKSNAPRSVEDSFKSDFIKLIPKLEKTAHLNLVAHAAFPAEVQEEILQEPEEIAEDYWIENGTLWIRTHVEPRQALFTPAGTQGSPDTSLLSGRRITKILYDDVSSDARIDDRYDGDDCHRSFCRLWTGQTLFEKRSAGDVYSDQQTLEVILEAGEDMLAMLPLPAAPADDRERR